MTVVCTKMDHHIIIITVFKMYWFTDAIVKTPKSTIIRSDWTHIMDVVVLTWRCRQPSFQLLVPISEQFAAGCDLCAITVCIQTTVLFQCSCHNTCYFNFFPQIPVLAILVIGYFKNPNDDDDDEVKLTQWSLKLDLYRNVFSSPWNRDAESLFFVGLRL